MKKITLLFSAIVLSLVALSQPITTVPYFCGFEETAENSQWQLNSGNSAIVNSPNFKNKWTIDAYAKKSGFNGMYIHYIDPEGVDKVSYDSVGMFTVAYREFRLPAGQYELAFNWRALGDSTADALYVYWAPATTATNSGLSTALPTPLNAYKLINTKTGLNFMSGKAAWQQATANITATTAGNKLVFIWMNNTKRTFNPGASVDNIQIVKRAAATDCWKIPTNITCVPYPNPNNPTGYQVSWTATGASTYDVIYFLEGAPRLDTISGIATNSVIIPIENFSSGLYTFWVRGNCNEVGLWGELQNVKIIDLSGLIGVPNACPEVSFSAFESTETGLKIIRADCSGQTLAIKPYIAAMGGSIAGYDVKQIPYAPPYPIGPVAGQTTQLFANASDDTWSGVIPLPFAFCFFENTYHQAVVGANGLLSFDVSHNLGSYCPWDLKSSPNIPSPNFRPSGYNVFNSIFGVYEDIYPLSSFLTPGVNGIYQGILGKYPCRMLCVSYKDIPLFGNTGQRNSYMIVLYEGSNVIDVFVEHREKAATGWNNQIGIIGLINADGTDGIAAPGRNTTSPTWEVNTIAEQEAWRFVPISTPTYNMNWYKGEGIDGQEIGRADSMMVSKGDGIDTITVRLRFTACSGDYFDLRDTAVIIWNEVDSINIQKTICYGTRYQDANFNESQTGIYKKMLLNHRGCDSLYYELDLTVQEMQHKLDSVTICYGESYNWYTQTYSREGLYLWRIPYSTTACDSLRDSLYVKVLPQINFTVTKQDIVAGPTSGSITINGLASNCYYTMNGVQNAQLTGLTEGEYTIIAYNEAGCVSDTVKVIIEKTCLNVEVDLDDITICAGDPNISVNYNAISGYATTYNIVYNATAKAAGFVDVNNVPAAPTGSALLRIPDNVAPGEYAVTLVFKDENCTDLSFDILFTILYAPDIITQRWNDVLAVRNKDYNGGYEFSAYQWYKNGSALTGEIKHYYFQQPALDFNAQYQVLLTRTDGIQVLSCPVVPKKFTDSEILNILVYPSAVIPGSSVSVQISTSAEATLYTSLGVVAGRYTLTSGDNQITMPKVDGIYILQIRTVDDEYRSFMVNVR